MNNRNVEELFALIENVRQENSCNKIRLLYGPKAEDFISSITFPDYVVLTLVDSYLIDDDKIYILKDFEDFPPIKVAFEDPEYDYYLDSFWKK